MTKSQSPHWLNWRAARWAVLAAAIPALWACNSRRLVEPDPAPSRTFNDLFQQSVNRNIDIVFMVDDSSSMQPLQKKLTANFPVFMDVLKKLPGGLPNVHIGVVSSSMGAGRNPTIDHCTLAQGNDQGVFHTKPLGTTCGMATLNAGQNYIVNVNGNANYTGDIADVFSCIAALGEGGCGFEHQFESVLRALGADGAMAPAQNNDFLRPDAYLAVILITNEDDCSAAPTSDLFDSTSSMVSDPLGPLQSYRCNEFGHSCGGKAPPRTPQAGPVDLSGTCVSAEDGRLLRVSDVVTAMKRLKADPNKVLVAAIAGPPTPYVVNWGPQQVKTDPNMWPYIQHSCMAADGTYGDPSIRIKQWVDAFGNNGVFEEICNQTFEPALTVIANEIGRKIGSPCVTGKVLDTTGALWTGASQPDCAVIDHQTNMAGSIVDTTLPPCAPGQNAGATACWHLDDGGTICPGAHVMGFNRPGVAPTTELNSSVACSVLACPPAGTPNPPNGCEPLPPRPFDKSALSITGSAGDDRGVLCLHGFTGTPFEVRPFAEAFGRAGFSVEAPMLAGHGETLRELARVTWADWVASAERKLDALQERTHGRPVAICGFSMGGLLALRLARRHPERVAALVVMGMPLRLRVPRVGAVRALCGLPIDFARWSGARLPKPNGSDISIPEMRHGNPGLPAFPLAALRQLFALMDVVRADLPEVRAPALVVHARHDHVVPMEDSLELTGSLGSEIIERLWLERSFHVVGLDVESDVVVDAASRFVARFVT